MNDDQMEDLLKRVRPVAPRPELRTRIVSAQRPAARAWPWVSAAAAMLAVTIALPKTNGQLPRRTLESTPWESEQVLLAEMLGGDAEAQRLADQIVAVNELRAAVIPVPPSATNVGSQ
jgi:hypothetical protein